MVEEIKRLNDIIFEERNERGVVEAKYEKLKKSIEVLKEHIG